MLMSNAAWVILLRQPVQTTSANPRIEHTPRASRKRREIVRKDSKVGEREGGPAGYRPALGLEDKENVVADPWDMIVRQPDRGARPIPSGIRIIMIFDELDGELLILGSPGAGKTTLVLELARHVLACAEVVDTLPIPVVRPQQVGRRGRQVLALGSA